MTSSKLNGVYNFSWRKLTFGWPKCAGKPPQKSFKRCSYIELRFLARVFSLWRCAKSREYGQRCEFLSLLTFGTFFCNYWWISFVIPGRWSGDYIVGNFVCIIHDIFIVCVFLCSKIGLKEGFAPGNYRVLVVYCCKFEAELVNFIVLWRF